MKNKKKEPNKFLFKNRYPVSTCYTDLDDDYKKEIEDGYRKYVHRQLKKLKRDCRCTD